MVVVDDLDEWLHLAALRLAGLGHAAGDLLWVALDSGDQSVREWVGLAAIVLRLDDDDLLSCVTSTGDDGLFSTVLVYHLDVRYSRGIRFAVVCSEGGVDSTYHTADLEDCSTVSISSIAVSQCQYRLTLHLDCCVG